MGQKTLNQHSEETEQQSAILVREVGEALCGVAFEQRLSAMKNRRLEGLGVCVAAGEI